MILDQINNLAKRTWPFSVALALVGAVMLYFHVTDAALSWFVVVCLIVAAPMVLSGLLAPVTLWRDSRGPPQDIPDEWH